jgi:branched-chain amino acid transport system permease protein
MTTILGIPVQIIYSQAALGIINGAFYALMSLGLAIIFGMLHIVNFAHGALFMLGAVVTWGLMEYAGLSYWWALFLAPLIVGLFGLLLERALIQRTYNMDHLYGLLLTFGLALIIEGLVRYQYGTAGLPYNVPAELTGAVNLGFMYLPYYRIWAVGLAVVACLVTWITIEKTPIGARLRAATENAAVVQAFGVNVPRLIALTYMAGAVLAGFAGMLAAPIYSVNPAMGANVLSIVFAVVVIGGMGSIAGSIITGFAIGLIEGMTKVIYPAASTTVVFLVMALVLLARPAGLFGKGK